MFGKSNLKMSSEPMEVDNMSTISSNNDANMGLLTYDVKYFKIELEKTVSYLSDLCKLWRSKLTNGIQRPTYDVNDARSHDICNEIAEINETKEGEIHVMIGKANIILGKKGRLQQFKDLIRNCEFGLGEKKTTCLDLQGFWEMINVHVDEIKRGFVQLSKLEENGWKQFSDSSVANHKNIKNSTNIRTKNGAIQPKTKGVFTLKKPSVTQDTKPSSGIREMMAAKRREMATIRNVKSPIISCTSDNTLKTGVVSSPTSVKKDDVVFDGGFFNISSPSNPRRLRSITPHSNEGRNLDLESLSAPSSSASTPVRSTAHALRRSLLVESASKLKSRENSSKSISSFAIVKVNSQIRRSISHNDTPKEPVFKKLRSRTILEHSNLTE